MSRSLRSNLRASSKEMVYGMVARTHKAPSSRCGMNSPPMKGTSNKREAEDHRRSGQRPAAMIQAPVEFAGIETLDRLIRTVDLFAYAPLEPVGSQHGTSVNVSTRPPSSANDIVSAIGWNSFPEGPLNA